MRLVDVNAALQQYLDGLVPPRDPLLARIESDAHRDGVPIVDPHEGSLLYLLVRIAGGKRVLELGTATGYSGIWLLRGTEGGTLTTYEMDPKRAETARANFAEAGFGQRAIVLEENAVQGLEKLEGRFDVCFIDLLNSFRSEEITRRVVDLCLEHLDGGALLMADNAINQGNVLNPKSQGERNARYYNELVSKHPQLESVVIPIRDGLSVARVKD
jgi:caffeoyl-CoA O-methyltransferase